MINFTTSFISGVRPTIDPTAILSSLTSPVSSWNCEASSKMLSVSSACVPSVLVEPLLLASATVPSSCVATSSSPLTVLWGLHQVLHLQWVPTHRYLCTQTHMHAHTMTCIHIYTCIHTCNTHIVHECGLQQHERPRRLHFTLHGWAVLLFSDLKLIVSTVQMCILLQFRTSEVRYGSAVKTRVQSLTYRVGFKV